MRLASIVLLYAFMVLAGCSEGTEEDNTTIASKPQQKPVSYLREAGTTHLLALVDNYYKVKDALVATKAAEADNAAGKLSASADSLISYIRSDSTNDARIVPFLNTIKTKVKAMTGMMDEGCEKKRIHFEGISAAMYTIVKKSELKNAGIYQQFCPMAFNNKGAYWLSNTEEIRNPYFGSKMLECGEITETLN